jgi:hypothetical protein
MSLGILYALLVRCVLAKFERAIAMHSRML